MKTFKVLVAIDFSDTSSSALDAAFEMAGRHDGGEVHLVTVQELAYELLVPAGDSSRSPVGPLKELAEKGLARHQGAWPSARIGTVTIHTVVGEPAIEIVALAAALDADTIVLGTHGRRGVRRALLGSVAESVVRRAGCPVLVVRAKHHPEALKTPEIEPACPECVKARAERGDPLAWCARHAEKHVHAHVYSFEERGADAARPWGFGR
jgi:nucleotide-binding universal stress UspA family protein